MNEKIEVFGIRPEDVTVEYPPGKKRVAFVERAEVGVLIRRGEWTVEELENAVKNLNASESRDLKHFLNYVDEHLNRLAEDLAMVKRAETDILGLLPLESPKRVNDIIVGMYENYIRATDTRLAIIALGRALDRFMTRFDDRLLIEVRNVLDPGTPLKLDASVPLEIAPYDEAMNAMAASMDTMTTGFLRLMKAVGDLGEKVAFLSEVQSKNVEGGN